MTSKFDNRSLCDSYVIEGPDSRIGTLFTRGGFVNLSGHEHFYRARGGATLGTDDCTGRRKTAAFA